MTGVFSDVFDDDIRLTPEMTADDVDGWDSMAHIRLVLATQKAFAIHFSAAEVGNLKTVGDFASLIQRKV